jgi:hypothetical protein
MSKLFLVISVWISMAFVSSSTVKPFISDKPDQNPKIQVALLLDTSGSMDGLIEQAKSQLWKMVNELATSKRDGKTPEIEIALYEYGKDSYTKEAGHIKQLVPLTTDLDLVSEELFKLKTNGGNEFCGWVISDATNELKWSKSNDDLKIIIIAGNEEFTQGPKDYKTTCKDAITKGIVVNTIFCGACEEGVRINWKDGADRADGKYMCISTNANVVHIATPFDDEIVKLNDNLNKTYIAYGKKGAEKKMRQEVQDQNAEMYSKANVAERAMSKSSNAYRNDDWDAVDAFKENEEEFSKLKDEDLPAEMKGMNKEDRKKYIEQKSAEREKIQNQIRDVNDKREKFIAEERKKSSSKSDNSLDEVMLKTIRDQAKQKKYSFDVK